MKIEKLNRELERNNDILQLRVLNDVIVIDDTSLQGNDPEPNRRFGE